MSKRYMHRRYKPPSGAQSHQFLHDVGKTVAPNKSSKAQEQYHSRSRRSQVVKSTRESSAQWGGYILCALIVLGLCFVGAISKDTQVVSNVANALFIMFGYAIGANVPLLKNRPPYDRRDEHGD